MSAFQPPADYTRREVEASAPSSAPSCPFYGTALVFLKTEHPGLARFGDSNRCALITSAHSPCWMEVAEGRAPDWAQCPRNPEWAVAQYANLDPPQYERQRDHMSFTAHRIAAGRHISAAKTKATETTPPSSDAP